MMDRILCFLIFLITRLAGFSKPLSRLRPGSYDEWKPGRKIKILLAGYNGARNTGSDARVAAIARQVKDVFGADNVQITVMTLDADSLAGYFDDDVCLLPFSSIFPVDLFRACCTHHAVILCEGSTLKSTFANALTLFLCEAAGVMGAQKKPCIAYGSEIGKMEPFLQRAARYFCRDTYFIPRSHESFTAMKALGFKGHEGTDAAWLYDGAISSARADEILEQSGWDHKKPLLGIAVIDPFCWPVRSSLPKWIRTLVTGNRAGQYDKWYYFSDSAKRRSAYRRYIREMAKTVNYMAENRGFYPVLIGMERLDEKACRDLRAGLRTPSAMFLSGYCSADIMTGILRRLSVLVTSRYHAAVLSMEHACPITAVSMDERLDGLMHELSLDADHLFHVTDPDLGRKICRSLADAMKGRRAIEERIRKQYAKDRETLQEMGSFMRTYIQERLGVLAAPRTVRKHLPLCAAAIRRRL